jgi:hypothetical protein
MPTKCTCGWKPSRSARTVAGGGLYHLAPEVLDAVKILKPETIIRWGRAGWLASPAVALLTPEGPIIQSSGEDPILHSRSVARGPPYFRDLAK